MRIPLLGVIFLCFTFLTFSQTREIRGKVMIDSVGVPGVNVVIKGTIIGTATDFDGNFALDIPSGDSIILIFSYIGYKTQEISPTGLRVINIYMEPDFQELDAVIVTGYKTEIKGNIIGAVSSISSKDFEEMPVTGIDQALQGQVAGVQVTQSSGTPGGGISVKVRGSTSISASNRPLFVVDGIPVEDGALALRSFGGQNDNALALLNPNDIESIQILKDASAKAMYGSRAANGVVIVTTKRGESGATNISFEVQRGLIDVVKKVELLDASQLLEIQREAVQNAGINPDAFGLIEGVTDGVNTDWLDKVLRRALLQSYQLTLSGGSDKTKMYFSSNYRDEEGVQWNNRLIRFTSTLNLDHIINSKASFGTNLTVSKIKNDRVKGDNFLDGVYSGAIKSLPYYSPFDENGFLIGPGDEGYAGFPNFNPLAQALLPRFETHATKVLGSVFVKIKLLEGLNLTSKFMVDQNSVLEDQFEPSSTAIGGFLPSVGGRGYGIYSTGKYTTLTQNNVVNYSTKIRNNQANFLIGTEVIYGKVRSSSVQGRMFSSDDFTYITSAGVVDAGSSFQVENGLMSVFGDANYNIEDKYIFSFAMRADGSSRFGPGRRFGFFPAASVGWRISSESFMDQFEDLDDLKLRVSYGYSGNQEIGNFNFLGTFAASTYNGISGISPASLGNEDLQWENTREINVGLEWSQYSGRIQATLDLYTNQTNKLLLTKPLPFTTGFGGVLGNVGNISNTGIELSIRTVNLDKQNLEWRTDVNLSRNSNVVLALSDTIPIFTGYSGQGVTATSIVKEGQPLGSFWGLEFLGVDPGTGDAIYRDINNDGRITDDDGAIIGNAQPDLIGGITNTVRYRNFDMSLFFQFSYGNEILNFSNTTLLNAGEDIENNQSVVALQRWQKPGDITSIPRYEWNNTYNNRHSSRFIEDGSYLRLKNLNLGYNVPPEWIQRFRISSLRAYISANNLWTLSRYSGADPEVSTLDGSITAAGIDLFTLPQVRTYMIGLKVRL